MIYQRYNLRSNYKKVYDIEKQNDYLIPYTYRTNKKILNEYAEKINNYKVINLYNVNDRDRYCLSYCNYKLNSNVINEYYKIDKDKFIKQYLTNKDLQKYYFDIKIRYNRVDVFTQDKPIYLKYNVKETIRRYNRISKKSKYSLYYTKKRIINKREFFYKYSINKTSINLELQKQHILLKYKINRRDK